LIQWGPRSTPTTNVFVPLASFFQPTPHLCHFFFTAACDGPYPFPKPRSFFFPHVRAAHTYFGLSALWAFHPLVSVILSFAGSLSPPQKPPCPFFACLCLPSDVSRASHQCFGRASFVLPETRSPFCRRFCPPPPFPCFLHPFRAFEEPVPVFIWTASSGWQLLLFFRNCCVFFRRVLYPQL